MCLFFLNRIQGYIWRLIQHHFYDHVLQKERQRFSFIVTVFHIIIEYLCFYGVKDFGKLKKADS